MLAALVPVLREAVLAKTAVAVQVFGVYLLLVLEAEWDSLPLVVLAMWVQIV